MQDLGNYIKAGYSVLYLLTWEETRAEGEIVKTILKLNDSSKKFKYNLKIWSHSDGFIDAEGKPIESTEDPIEALNAIKQEGKSGMVYIFRDLHKFFNAPKVLRIIRDVAKEFKQKGCALIILSPISQIPPDIQRDITLIDFDLPTKEELAETWKALKDSNKSIGSISEDEDEMIVSGAAGLTSIEAENAFAKAVVVYKGAKPEDKVPLSKLVMREKAAAVKKNGILEYSEAPETIDSIGGLDQLKEFLKERRMAYTKKATEFGLPKPRGITLVGLPGCGKSLSAKAASNIMGVPLIKFDIGRVFAGLVGQSEENMRIAIQTIEAVSSCIVWIDEMDKAFAGTGDNGGGGDSGVTKRVFGNFLSWMQDKKCPAFIIATVNRIQGLPPELLRKGRFDEIFFVGLPSFKERVAILQIHVNRLAKKLKDVDIDYEAIAKVTEGYSGAELEEAVVAAMYKAFYKEDTLKTEYIKNAAVNSPPLSKSAAQNLKDMASWAVQNAVPASSPDSDSTIKGFTRKLDI